MLAEGFYEKGRAELQGNCVSGKPKKSLSFKEYCGRLIATLDDLCSQMLAIGMPYDLYWSGELGALDLYLNSVKYRNMLINNDMYLQGIYFLKALQEVLQFKNPVRIYPEKPLDLTSEEDKKPNTQEQVEADMKAYIEQMKGERNG